MWVIAGFGLKRLITKCLRKWAILRKWAAAGRELRYSLPSLVECLPFWTAEPKAVGEVVSMALSLTQDDLEQGGGYTMQQRLHWLDYDPVAFAVLAIGMGMIALLASSIWTCPNPPRALPWLAGLVLGRFVAAPFFDAGRQ
jgi:hypothetical protein